MFRSLLFASAAVLLLSGCAASSPPVTVAAPVACPSGPTTQEAIAQVTENARQQGVVVTATRLSHEQKMFFIRNLAVSQGIPPETISQLNSSDFDVLRGTKDGQPAPEVMLFASRGGCLVGAQMVTETIMQVLLAVTAMQPTSWQ